MFAFNQIPSTLVVGLSEKSETICPGLGGSGIHGDRLYGPAGPRQESPVGTTTTQQVCSILYNPSPSLSF